MGKTLSKLNLIALTASGAAAELLREFLGNLREDVASAIAGTPIYHQTLLDNSVEKNADSTDLPTAIVLVNSLRARMVIHLPSTGTQGVHATASAEAVSEPVATDQTSAEDMANEIKATYNTHLTESDVHLVDDATNTVVAVDATDLPSLLALTNEIKADFNAHVVMAMAAMLVEA